MSLYQTSSSLHSEHPCKSVNPHRHCATDTSTRKTQQQDQQIGARQSTLSTFQADQSIMAIDTTSLRRHWPNLAREKDITHWACTEVRMLEEDQLWFSERHPKEDKISVTWGAPMNRREDGRPEFGGTCVISRQPAFSVLFENSDYHETLRWLLTTKRFLMVKIPIGNGSNNVAVMVENAYTGPSKEANAQNEHIFDTVVGLTAGLGDIPLMTCGDLQHEPRKQSRHLDFALSQGWLTDLGQTHKPVGAAQFLHTHEQGDTKTRLHNPCIPMSKEIQKRAWPLHWHSTKPSAVQW